MFALLEHRTPDGVHWDLLIEQPGIDSLATWRLAENPILLPGPIPAQRIADHRRLYLDYEGDIAGGRGSVRRLDRGTATVERAHAGAWIVRLGGAELIGRFALRSSDGGEVFARIDGAA